MATRSRLSLLLAGLFAGASSLQLFGARTALTRATSHPPVRSAQWARAGELLAMADEAEEEAAAAEPAEPAAEAEPAPEAAADGQPQAAEKPKEEAADDLLNSPAFLKQKLKVLEKELQKLAEETEGAKAEAAAQAEGFGDKRQRLQADFENFKVCGRHCAPVQQQHTDCSDAPLAPPAAVPSPAGAPPQLDP